ncbi:hypothetical protein LSCM4_04203 [Leishmania orientalis]|uniref:Uncharacterized protein n=1 Tax=Leishmania orientalis TaxID=2249476 RepID=A0A836GID0_9TRYP|nr:hypothetical protein LSCM4_04203 [Leishmania orientalis]
MQRIDRRSPSQGNVAHQVHALSVPSAKQRESQAVLPSRLRYVGAEVAKRVSPSDLLRGVSAAKSHHQSTPRSVESSKRSTAPNTFPLDHESISAALPWALHPLLQQALLLVEAAEVKERLTVSQEEMDAFDSIITLLSVAREVETIRVAAFEMFHIERASRRAVKRQERHERRILQRWYCESYQDALLSEEVRIIRQQSDESRSVFDRSFLHARSTSLRQQMQNPLDVAAPRIRPLSSKNVPHSQLYETTSSVAPLRFSAPRQQCVVVRNSSPTENCAELRHSSAQVLSPMPSKPSFPYPVNLSRSLSTSSDSVNVSDGRQYYRKYGGHRRSTVGSMEADLENRISWQEASLLRSKQSYQK